MATLADLLFLKEMLSLFSMEVPVGHGCGCRCVLAEAACEVIGIDPGLAPLPKTVGEELHAKR